MKTAIFISLFSIVSIFASQAFSQPVPHTEKISDQGLHLLRQNKTIQNCYESYAKISLPKIISADLTYDIHLSKTGDVLTSRTSIDRSSIHDEKLNQCIIDAIKLLKFDKEGGKEKTVFAIIHFPIS